jgi:hypothetical protein
LQAAIPANAGDVPVKTDVDAFNNVLSAKYNITCSFKAA